jgi:UDP-N-acetylglucosamine:LPS N-acetylglucosamine transferase
VQNAGGLTTSEALASGLPVLTYRCLPGHGRANAQVLDADGTVPWVRRQEDLPDALVWAIAMAQNESAQQTLAQKALAQKERPVVERVAG